MKKALISWSSGKDSALALYYTTQQKKQFPIGLVTTLSQATHRIAFHEIPKELVEKQAESLGLPLHKIFLPVNCTNEVYESFLKENLTPFQENGVSEIVFGDLFLEDIRKYREVFLKSIQWKAHFPLWGLSTQVVAREIIQLGFKAIITAIDSTQLSTEFLGMEFNNDFLNKLPPTVDPCGENGEFHTFVYGGGIFTKPVAFRLGKVFGTKSNAYIDVLPQI